MKASAREALSTIRRCIAADRVRVLPHFRARLAERGLLWSGILAVIDSPLPTTADGHDDCARDRWKIRGRSADGQRAGLVCVIDRSTSADLAVFVTIFWED